MEGGDGKGEQDAVVVREARLVDGWGRVGCVDGMMRVVYCKVVDGRGSRLRDRVKGGGETVCQATRAV
jgi:hypothetical protein